MGCCTSFLKEVAPLRSSSTRGSNAAQDCEVASEITQLSPDLASPSQSVQSAGGLVYRTASSATKGLIAFAKTGDLVRGRELLMQGADPSAPGMWGSTPLLVACEYGRPEFAELLLSYKCGVDTPNHKNATPLLYACIHGFQTIVDKLVAEGATVDPEVAVVYNPKHDVVGPLTPLAAAAANGYDDIVRKLTSAGAQINRTLEPIPQEKKELPYVGATALSIACAMGHTTVVQSLLAASADVSIGDFAGNTPLHYACMQTGAPELVDEIIQHARGNHKFDIASILNATNQRNETALHIACAVGALRALEALLEAGADPNIVSKNHWAPLHIAVQKGCKAGVCLLVSRGADPTIQDLAEQTPFDLVVKLGQREIVDLLEQHCPPIAFKEAEQPVGTPPAAATDPLTSSSEETAVVLEKPSSVSALPMQPTSPTAKKSEVLSPRATRVASAARAGTPTKPAKSAKPEKSANSSRKTNSRQQQQQRQQVVGTTTPHSLSPRKPTAPRTTPTSTLAKIRQRPAPIKTDDLEAGNTLQLEVTSPESQATQQPEATATEPPR